MVFWSTSPYGEQTDNIKFAVQYPGTPILFERPNPVSRAHPRILFRVRTIGCNKPDSWNQQEQNTRAVEMCVDNLLGVQIIQTLCDCFDPVDTSKAVLHNDTETRTHEFDTHST